MKISWNIPGTPTPFRRLAAGSVLCILLLCLIGGSASIWIMGNVAAGNEARRLGDHLRAEIGERLAPGDLQAPLPPQAIVGLDYLFGRSTLARTENLKRLRLWSAAGKLLWSSQPDEGEAVPVLPPGGFREALRKGFAFRLAPPNSFLPAFRRSSSPLSLSTWVAIAGADGGPADARSRFVAEAITESLRLPAEIAHHVSGIWLVGGSLTLLGLALVLWGLAALGRMHAAASRQAAHGMLTGKITRALSSDLDPDRLFRNILQEIRKAVPCDRIVIAGVDPAAREHRIWHVEHTLPVPYPSDEEQREMGDWYLRTVYSPMRPVNFPDLEKVGVSWARRLLKAGMQSSFVLPIRQEEKGHFVHLGLSWTRKGGLDAEGAELLSSLADHLGSAVRNAELFRMAETRASRLATLNVLSQKIAQNVGLEETLEAIVQAAVELLGADISRAFLLEEETGNLIPQAHAGRIAPPIFRPGTLRIGQGIIGRVADSGEPVILTDVQDPQGASGWVLDGWARENGLHSYIAYPLRLGGKPFGAIYCLSAKIGLFTHEDLELLGSFSFQAAIAIEKARLIAEIQKRALRLELAGEITKALASTLRPGELFQTIVREIRRAIPCERCVIGSLATETRRLRAWHIESEIDLPLPADSLAEQATWWEQDVYGQNRYVNVPDLTKLPYKRLAAMSAAGLRSLLVMPILQDGACTAHMLLASTRLANFTRDHEQLLNSLSGHLGMAIRNALLYQASEEKTSRLEITGEIAKALGSSLEPEEIFRTITREIRRAVPCERCVIASVDPGDPFPAYWHTDSDIEMPPLTRSEAEAIHKILAEKVYERKEPHYIPDFTGERGPEDRFVRRGFRSQLFIPVLDGSACIAHISLSSTRGHGFSQAQRELLASIAAYIGPAIRNAKLYRTAEERTSRLSVLNELNRKISENLELGEVLNSITQAVPVLLPADYARIFMIDPETKDLVLQAAVGIHPWPEGRRASIPPHGSLSSWVIENERPALIPDIQADPRWCPMPWEWIPQGSIRSAICHPLMQGGRPIGIILALAEPVETFTQEDLALLGGLASQASIAIEKAVHFSEARERAVRLSVLNQLTQKIIATRSLDEILNALLQSAAELLKGEHVHIFLFDEAEERLKLRASYGDVPMQDGRPLTLRAGEGIGGRVFMTGLPVNVRDVNDEPHWLTVSWSRETGVRSCISQPLTQHGRNIGIINCFSRKAGFFSEEDVTLLGALASQAAIAIEKTGLLGQAQERAARLELSGEIARALSSTLEPEHIFRIIVSEIRSAVPCERCLIARLDPATKAYQYLHVESEVPVGSFPDVSTSRGSWFHREVYQTRSPKLIPDLTQIHDEMMTAWSDRLIKAGLRSLLIIPILQDGRCIAHISLTTVRPNAFSQEQIDLLTSVAQHVGSAIRNASLYRTAEQRASRLLVLNRLNRYITENLALDETLGSIVHAAYDLLDADLARLYLLDEPSNRLSQRALYGNVPLNRGVMQSFAFGQGITGAAAETGESFIIHDVQSDPRWLSSDWARENDLHSFIVQPLRQGGRIVGVLNCVSRKYGLFAPSDLELLSALASQAAIAVQNARLHDEEKRSREFLNSVVGDTSDPITITNLERTILLWNSGAEELYGHTESDVLGRKIDIIIPEEDAARNRAVTARVISEKAPYTYETRRLRKDGVLVPVSITISPVQDEREAVVALAGIHKDLSEWKRAERALQEAKEEAEAANRAKSVFLSNLNHELRSPLNAVTGLSDILRLETRDGETAQVAQKIREAGEHMLRLIEDLLDLDRISTGKLSLQVRGAPIDGLVRSAAEARIRQLPQGFTLASDLRAEGCQVRCDPTRVRQILGNLLDNAVKYSPAGGTIAVRTERRGDEAWVSVQDQGIGISPQEARVIFDRFAQLESGGAHRGGGLGIGLHLVKQLLALQGGRIWMQSEKGAGSTFIFSLPLVSPDAPPAGGENGEAARPAAAETDEPWEGASVLVVESEAPSGYLKMLMRNAGRLLTARMEEGLEAARKERPDLILLDIEASRAEGLRLLERLKGLPETRGIPTVAISSEGAGIGDGNGLRADGFLSKPIDPVAFRLEIGRVLAGRAGEKKPRTPLPAPGS